jgi:hypothetical protein
MGLTHTHEVVLDLVYTLHTKGTSISIPLNVINFDC